MAEQTGGRALSDRLNQGIDFWNDRPAAPLPGTEQIGDVLENWNTDSAIPVSGAAESGGGPASYELPAGASVPVVSTPGVQPGVTPGFANSAAPRSLMVSPSAFAKMPDEVASDLADYYSRPHDEPVAPEFTSASEWEQAAADSQGRAPRTQNVFGEDFEDKSGIPDGAIEQYMGNTQTNDAYIRNALDHGLSEDVARLIMAGQRPVGDEDGPADEDPRLLGHMVVDPQWTDHRRGKTSLEVVDDGSSYDYPHMTADDMTGVQYLRYSEMGMGGRPANEIDPEGVYSKVVENRDHQFIPFVPDRGAVLDMGADAVIDVPSRVGDAVANARTENPFAKDYKISFVDQGGEERTISGKEFDKLSTPFINQYRYNKRFSPERYLAPPTDGSDYDTLVLEQAIPDSSGRDTYHYGNISGPIRQEPDGTFSMSFDDGSTVNMSADYVDSIIDPETDTVNFPKPRFVPIDKARGKVPDGLSNDIPGIMRKAIENGEGDSPEGYANIRYVPAMVMSDGTRISLDDVSRIHSDRTAGNDEGDEMDLDADGTPDYDPDADIGYKFRAGVLPGMDNKPQRLKNQEVFGEGGSQNWSDLGDNVWDWTLGSLPISLGKYMPWVYSASKASSSLKGVDPSTFDPSTGAYSLIAGNYDDDGNLVYGVTGKDGSRDDARSDELRYASAAGNAAVPLTEMLAGPVGHTIAPLEKVSNKIFGKMPSNPTLGQVARNFLVGAGEEGVEEVVGNIPEQFTQNGVSGFYADPLLDEEGNEVYDQTGHKVMDYDTPALKRLANALKPEDAANAFLGGVAVDFLLDGTLNGPATLASARNAIKSAQIRKATGVKQFVEPEDVEEKDVSGDFLDRYNENVMNRLGQMGTRYAY